MRFVLKVCFISLFLLGLSEVFAKVSETTHNETTETTVENDPITGDTATNVSTNDAFLMACQDPQDVRDVPRTHLGKRRVPLADNQGVLARDYLMAVVQNLTVYADQSGNMADNVDFCLQDHQKHPSERMTGDECKQYTDWAKGPLVNEAKKARYHLSIAQNAFDRDWKPSTRLTVSYEPNTALTVPRGSYKETPWDPLTSKEHQVANEVLEKYRQHVWSTNKVDSSTFEWKNRGHAKRTRPFKQAVSREMRYFRNEHLRRYNDTLSEIPLLQFIKSAHPDAAEIQGAAQKVRDLAEKEVKRLLGLMTELQALGPGDRIPQKFFDLMSFAAFSEGVLLNNPKYCSIATAISKTRDNRQLGNAIGISLPLFAIGLAASPLVAVGAGVAASIPLSLSAKKSYDQALEQRFAQIVSHYEGSTGNEAEDKKNPFRGQALKEVVQARSNLQTELLLAPTSLIGGGLTRGTARLIRGALPSTHRLSLAAQRAGGLQEPSARTSWLKLTRSRLRPNN